MITMPNSETDLSRYSLPQVEQELTRNQLGQDQFLQLMLTQLQNQDPLQPMEDGEFISQMAQFSTVEELGGMSQSLETLAASLTSSMALQASTMVGRSVLVDGDTGLLEADAPFRGGVDLPAPLTNASVRIYDASGQLVREMPLGSRNQGMATFEWDGTTNDGETAEPGTYVVRAAYRNGDVEESLPTYVAARVDTITLNGGGSNADITTADGQRISLSKIKAIM